MPSAKPKKPFRSLAEQIAEINDPAPPKEVDVDGLEAGFGAGGSSEDEIDAGSSDEEKGREHYQHVGKSKLRRAEMPALGAEYAGARVSRGKAMNGGAMLEGDEGSSDEDDENDGGDVEMDDDDEDEDEDAMAHGFSSDSNQDQSEDASNSDSDSNEDQNESDEDGPLKRPQPQGLSQSDRAAMRTMMLAEQKALAANLSQAANEDVLKGRAVRKQRDVYTSHLNARIKLQKGLVEANSLGRVLSTNDAATADDQEALRAAEEAALKLLQTITDLQSSLPLSSEAGQKRSHSTAFTSSTPSSEIHAALSSAYEFSVPHHRAVLQKWSSKTQSVSASMRPSHDKLGGVNSAPTILAGLDHTLRNPSAMDRLVTHSQTPRSSAPLHVAAGIEHSVDIYDDAGFYALLLREFIEARSASSSAATPSAVADVDVAALLRHANRSRRKDVDTKASKGRKLKYTVHEKLQNFMAPNDRGSWSERQQDELFAGLLGRKVRGGLGEREDEDEEGDEGDVGTGMDREMEGLRLFRSAAAS